MPKLLLVALLAAAPLFSMPAAAFACDWFGYGYSPAYTPQRLQLRMSAATSWSCSTFRSSRPG